MQYFVRFEVFDTITGPEEIQMLRKTVGAHLDKTLKSGKVTGSGIFADARGGFLLLNVASGEEVRDILGGAILDHFRVETHPFTSVQALGEFFAREAKG